MEITKRLLERHDTRRFIADERQLQVVGRVKGRRLEPCQVGRVESGVVGRLHYRTIVNQLFDAVVGERLSAGVELVDEELGAPIQPR